MICNSSTLARFEKAFKYTFGIIHAQEAYLLLKKRGTSGGAADNPNGYLAETGSRESKNLSIRWYLKCRTKINS